MKKSNEPQLVINWHLMEPCNYRCRYCYAEWGKPMRPLPEVYKDENLSMELLAQIATITKDEPVRLTFAGGEPLLDKKIVLKVAEAKRLGIDVSIITNASVRFDQFVRECSTMVSWLGISLDAEGADVNRLIQRAESGKVLDIERLKKRIEVARRMNSDLKVKINTVVNRYNYNEDMSDLIAGFAPDKWKLLRVLPSSPRGREQAITDEQFSVFCERHKHFDFVVKEDNEDMLNSYLMIDPYGRFFFNGEDDYRYSQPILEVGIDEALKQVDFDRELFNLRYD